MTVAQLIPLALRVSIFLTVFALGLDAGWKDATWFFRHPNLLARSIFSMNIAMAIFAVGVASVFDLNPAIETAIVALYISPVPPIFPKKERKASGSRSYAIGLVVAAAFFSIILIPCWIEFLGRYFGFEVHVGLSKVIPILLISTIVPLFAGILIRTFAGAIAERAVKPVSSMATLLLIAAVLPVLFTQSRAMWSMLGNGVVGVLALFALVGLAVGHLIGGPDAEERSVLALATSTRHPGIAMAIAGLNFPERTSSVMVVVLFHLIVGGIVAIPYMNWCRRQHAEFAAK